jgi:hypothetical protein
VSLEDAMESKHERGQEDEVGQDAGPGGPVPREEQVPEPRREAERLGDGSPAIEPRQRERTDESR